LKGALSNMAATHATTLASSLEMTGESRNLSDAGRTFAELKDELLRVDKKLQAICPELVQ
jgi:HPt (histidine-containing phosphotransfer) domain-containing protein